MSHLLQSEGNHRYTQKPESQSPGPARRSVARSLARGEIRYPTAMFHQRGGVKLIGPPEGTDLPEVAIAVMGATGTGKSSFINLVSGSNLGVAQGLRSCTEEVQTGAAFKLDGRRVVLIDTPGFDDTVRSDTDVLKMIAAFLAASYEQGCTLAGVLYFHRISDFKMGGISTRNFNMFRKLCGETTLRNVVIVTNMWGEVNPQLGDAREAELKGEDVFFKPVLDKGARMARHDNTGPSAEKIIGLLLENHPLPLRIQEELVDEQKDISETSAGEELNRELVAQIKKHQQEMDELREKMEQAMDEKDEETRKELEAETEKMQEEIKRLEHDATRLKSDYSKEKAKFQMRSNAFVTIALGIISILAALLGSPITHMGQSS